MSTTLNPTVAAISSNVTAYTPAVIAGVQAAEVSGQQGASKLQTVVNAVLGTAGALEQSSNPNVAAISALVNLVVSIFNSTGIFSHKSAAASAAPAATQASVVQLPVNVTVTQ